MNVYVLVIDHEYGTDVFVFKALEAAEVHLLGYVNEWWEDQMDDAEMPENDDDAIFMYFDNTSEWYLLREEKVL